MGDSVTESKILWLSTKGQEKGVKFELVSFGGVERTQVSPSALDRGGGSSSKLGAQFIAEAQILSAQNHHILYLWPRYWVRKCAPLRIRFRRPWYGSFTMKVKLGPLNSLNTYGPKGHHTILV